MSPQAMSNPTPKVDDGLKGIPSSDERLSYFYVPFQRDTEGRTSNLSATAFCSYLIR